MFVRTLKGRPVRLWGNLAGVAERRGSLPRTELGPSPLTPSHLAPRHAAAAVLDDARVRMWLATLSEDVRAEVLALFDKRLDDIALVRPSGCSDDGDGGSAFGQLPIVLAGTLIEPDHEGSPEAWHQDFYEYAADQKYIFIEQRTFHICTRAKSARRALRLGVIPSRFRCSEKSTRCPMLRLLRACPGRSIRLSLNHSRRPVADLASGPLRGSVKTMSGVDYEVRVGARDGYVYVLQRGTFTTEAQLRELQGTIVAEAWRAKTDRVLFDNREATQASEDLRAIMWTWLSSCAPIRRAAIVVHSERITQRADRTAKMNRVKLQAFNDEAAAARWLQSGMANGGSERPSD